MYRGNKFIQLAIFFTFILFSAGNVAQAQSKKTSYGKRQAERRAMHSRDSLMRSLNKSDTSISSLLQRIEQYTTSFNQIKNSLAQGLDTVEVSQQLPPIVKRIDKISSVAATHKASTLRYLFVIRDNLDHIQNELEGWQSDLMSVNTKLAQNQSDLVKFSKDTTLRAIPSDSVVRKTFFGELRLLKALWRKTDSCNRNNLLKVNLLQDKLAISYTKTLDESDQIDSKIKEFALKAISGESTYIWIADSQYGDFGSALNNTVRLNKLLFNFFIKSETPTHLISILFLVLIFSWVYYYRIKFIKDNAGAQTIPEQANLIYQNPKLSSLLVVTAIVPYFYDHPPAVFLETLFLISIILSLILIRKQLVQNSYRFLVLQLLLGIAYGVSNLFIQISNIDRYVILGLGIISIVSAYRYYRHVKSSTEIQFPYAKLILRLFIFMEALSLLLDITGRFSLAKIIGVTAVFNLWFFVVLYLVVTIIMQNIFIQFQIKRDEQNILNWIDFALIQKKIKKLLFFGASVLWLFFLLQNLNIDDWAIDYGVAILNQPETIGGLGGATFTFGGFVIFAFVIWLSSIASKIISYLYDISAQRVTDLSVLKKKNRTSALIIRIGVFSIGFLLAVAASGFPLDKLTIIISAFGVGIGFGLQNIVNNLVSGLILAFEKPINIGDVVQVDGHMGTMKEIGIRSSKVVTGDGSEVIIPNGDLISHQVINWTLSNSNRQVELKVLTAYGVDITKVKEMLKTLLSNRDDIMSTPGPAVFVNNVNESAVEFKVLFWVADISTTGELKSKILTDIYQAIDTEAIRMPSAQKDFYLHFPDGVPIENTAKTIVDEKEIKKDVKENLPEKDQ